MVYRLTKEALEKLLGYDQGSPGRDAVEMTFNYDTESRTFKIRAKGKTEVKD